MTRTVASVTLSTVEGEEACTHSSNQGQSDPDTVGKVDTEVEEEHGKRDGQHLLAVGSDRHRKGLPDQESISTLRMLHPVFSDINSPLSSCWPKS